MDVELLKEKEKYREKYTRELSAKLKHEGVKIQLEEEFLVKFLRSRLYNVDQTCGAIKTYLANFKKYPKFFTGVDVIKDAVESGFFEILPERNVTGETISIMRPAKWNPSKMSFNQCIASTVYAFELDKMDEEAQINGTIEIIDMKDAGFRQFSKLGLSEIRFAADMSEHALPIRWRKIFVVNENHLTDILYGMAKPFFSKDFKERIAIIGSDFSQLQKLIPPQLIPTEYGGTYTKNSGKEFFKRLAENESRLMKLWEPFKK